MQFAILAQSRREMSQTDRIHPRYFLSRVRVSIRPRFFLYAKKPQTIVARILRSALQRLTTGLEAAEPRKLGSVAVTRSANYNVPVASAGSRVQNPCGNNFIFTFIVCDSQDLLLINPRNIISNTITIFIINLTRGQMRFLTCVARVTCLVQHNECNTKHQKIFMLCIHGFANINQYLSVAFTGKVLLAVRSLKNMVSFIDFSKGYNSIIHCFLSHQSIYKDEGPGLHGMH